MKAVLVARRIPRPGDLVFAAGTLLVCLSLAKVLPGRLEALSSFKLILVPVMLVFVAGIAWLAIVRPFVAFVIGFALLSVVQIQPAPVDVAFIVLMLITLATSRVRPNIPPFVLLPIAAFVAVSLISIANSVDLSRAISFEAITLYMIGFGLWISWACADPRWMHAAVKVYIIGAAVSGALGPIALYLPLPAKHLFIYDSSRAQGFFKDPNVYSAFLVPAAVFLLEELSTPRILRWRRRTIAALFVIVSVGVTVAYSRAAWLDLAVAISTLLVVQATRKGGLRRAAKIVGALALTGSAGFFVLLETGSLTFLQQRSHYQTYDNQRFSNQATAFDAMTRHLFGYGPGQTEVLLPISTHSSYARAAFEQGLPGLTLLIAILGGTLLCAALLARRTDSVNGVGTAALLAIWLGQLANSFFIDTLHWRHLWIIAGLIWCAYSLERRRTPTSESHVRPHLAAATSVARSP